MGISFIRDTEDESPFFNIVSNINIIGSIFIHGGGGKESELIGWTVDRRIVPYTCL